MRFFRFADVAMTEWKCFVRIVDQSSRDDIFPEKEGLQVNLFVKTSEAFLPSPQPGDIIVFRHLSVSGFLFKSNYHSTQIKVFKVEWCIGGDWGIRYLPVVGFLSIEWNIQAQRKRDGSSIRQQFTSPITYATMAT
jgi:hypothetical protein